MRHSGAVRSAVMLAVLLQIAGAAAPPAAQDDGARSGGASSGGVSAILIGHAAMLRGDVELAAAELLHAHASAPANHEIARQALVACVLAGRPEAMTVARTVAQDEPGNPIAALVLAADAAARGDWVTAARHYTTMAPQGIFATMQQPLLAWAQFAAGRADPLRALLGPTAQRGDGAGGRAGGAYLFQAALMADLSGQPAEAERRYRAAATDLGANDFTLARALASLQARQGRMAEARRTLAASGDQGLGLRLSAARLRAVIARRPVRDAADALAAVHAAFAEVARQQGSPDLARMLLRLALRLRADFTMARLQAAVLEVAQHAPAGLAVLAPVAADDPLAPSADLLRARLHDRLGDTDTALRLLDTLARAQPDRAEPWALRATLLREHGRDTEAVAADTRALDLRGTSGGTRWQDYHERATAEQRCGQTAAAQADWLAALALAPDEPTVLRALAQAWAEQGRSLDRARVMIEHAAAQRPDDADIAASLGFVALRSGDVATAIWSLERAVTLRPEDPLSNTHLGDAYRQAGRTLEARFQWRRALTLTQDADAAADLRARLAEAVAGDAPAAAAIAARR